MANRSWQLWRTSAAAPSPEAARFLSEAACQAVLAQIVGFAHKGGTTDVAIESTWTGNIHWGRNTIDTSGDVQNTTLTITRAIRGAAGAVSGNQLSPAALEAAVRRAERLLLLSDESTIAMLAQATSYTEPYQVPPLWYDRTDHLDAAARAAAMRQLVQPARAAGMLSAGYIEVAAHGRAIMNTTGRTIYHPFTVAQYSVTVRDPEGTGSGWAGVDSNDWGRIDAERLSAIALEKCLTSRHSTAIEPGRYTTILEPQAVCDLVSALFDRGNMDRYDTENVQPNQPRVFSGPEPGTTEIGELVIDERLTLTTDPMDPELAFLPVGIDADAQVTVYHPTTWIEHGVLQQLAYDRDYAVATLGENAGLPFQGAFRLSGGTTSVDEMIATTDRGLLVTRLVNVEQLENRSCLCRGMTRDGIWLIEHGKISKSVRNFQFTESPLAALNRIEQLGTPQRVFRPGYPTVVPALKVRDFNFSSLIDAI